VLPPRHVLRSARATLVAGILLSVGGRAVADPAAAEALFREGRRLLSEGNVAAACDKFAASERMEPSSGTLLNLADCDARAGKTASAWAEFLGAARMARNHGDGARADEAARRANQIEPTLSHLTIQVAARVPGLRIQRDDVVVEEASLASAIPVDPGAHAVSASAPGFQSWSTSVVIAAKAGNQDLVVPALQPAAANESFAPAPVGGSLIARPAARDGRTVGYAIAGAGLVAAVVGGVFGAKALSTYSDAESDCHGGHTNCPASSGTKYDTADSQATVANVGMGVGIVAVAVGAYLIFVNPPPSSRPRSASGLSIVLWNQEASTGSALAGRF
jgi:hypothetical protein